MFCLVIPGKFTMFLGISHHLPPELNSHVGNPGIVPLVGGFNPLKNMSSSIWDDDIPTIYGKVTVMF